MLRKYTVEDFKYLESWVTDAETLFMFSGPEWQFPLTESQIEKHQAKYPFKQMYVGCDENGIPYALGELIWNEPDSPRLGRLLIGDQNQRGKGLGTAFIKELIAELVKELNPESVCLFVFEDNVSAIRCYKKTGFTFDDAALKDIVLDGKVHRMFKMNLWV